MRIRWTPTAAADLQGIYDYLREHEPHLARPTVLESVILLARLRSFPFVGTRAARKAPANYRIDGCHTSLPTV
jgi:plasmid stabilization system protein ParE